ncbi:MAG TPA: hypothetical protein VGF86_12810 [Candidatus Tumulicola sp.]|jgi:hypothetical protein
MIASASARCGALGFVAVLLAGCSLGAVQIASPSGQTADLLNARTTPSKLLALQLEGRLPAPIPLRALREQVKRQALPRPHRSFHAGAKVAVWASDTNFDYVLGQSMPNDRTVTAIDTSANNCFSPIALKVDHAQNLWVGCELRSTSGTNGVVQEYGSTGTLRKQYVPGCPSPVSECQSFSGFGYDSGLDSAGHVFASLNLFSIETCTPSCVSTLGAGFEWWPAGKPSAAPKLISVGANCAPICGVGYMDVDGAGNLWFTFSGYDSESNFGFGLGEIANPTTHPALTIVEPIGTYEFFGGVYVSNGGKTLNVLDQNARTISRYKLPVSPNAAPFKVLGPTLVNAFGIGDPVSGAFNAGDTKIAIGDTGGWLDLGKVAANRWTSTANPNFYSGLGGAAYTPSDK